MNWEYRSSHQSQLGKNKSKRYAKNTLPSPTKKYSGWLDQTPPNSACWPRYEGGPSPLGQLGMLYRVTRVSTQQCLGALSRPWLKAFAGVKPVTLERRSYLKKPSTTSSERASPKTTLIRSDPSKKLPRGTKRIEGKLTSTFHAKMG